MGYTGLARWINAPTNGLELITENIIRNHSGALRGRWQLSVRSYRSTLTAIPGAQIHAERSMCALTMNDNVFVLLDDPANPQRADVVQAYQHQQQQLNNSQAQAQQGQTGADSATAASLKPHEIPGPPHYRTTFVILRPPGAFEQLMAQLRARWLPVRQATAAQASGQQLTVDGMVYAIGNDWLVRAGRVVLAGGAVKGILLEAEYLPCPAFHSDQGNSELLSNLLTSILPNLPDAKTAAVTVSDVQWEDGLWSADEEEEEAEKQEVAALRGEKEPKEDEDDVYAYANEEKIDHPRDWTGEHRDKRSAYMIIGALRSEGIL